MNQIEFIPGGTITSPGGFSAGATHAGIKRNGDSSPLATGDNALDLGILYSQRPCTAAGVFTSNKIKSAAVVLSQQYLQRKGKVSAVVANSGCANSSTGKQGLFDAGETAELVAKAIGIEADEVLVASTGVIGVRLPMDLVRAGISRIVLTGDGGHSFTRAIMTTDTVPKEVAVTIKSDDVSFTIGGAAKGSGMIHPDMGTMLSFITTDAAVSPEFLSQALHEAVAISFNMISVDGDTSPSDTLLLLANGIAGNKPISEYSPLANVFQQALNQVCVYLARAIAGDGEGATKLIEVTVRGAVNLDEARRAARTVVSSNLVKTAVYGCDPNWGRVTAALGRSGVEVNESKLGVWMAGIQVFKAGAPVPFDKNEAVGALKNKEVPIVIALNLGPAAATAWGCDLTEQYVVINSQYTT